MDWLRRSSLQWKYSNQTQHAVRKLTATALLNASSMLVVNEQMCALSHDFWWIQCINFQTLLSYLLFWHEIWTKFAMKRIFILKENRTIISFGMQFPQHHKWKVDYIRLMMVLRRDIGIFVSEGSPNVCLNFGTSFLNQNCVK